MIKIRYSDFAKILAALYNNVSVKKRDANFYKKNPWYKPGFITIQEAGEILSKTECEIGDLIQLTGDQIKMFVKKEKKSFVTLMDRYLGISFINFRNPATVMEKEEIWSFLDEEGYDDVYGKDEAKKVIEKNKCKIFWRYWRWIC